jgi:hypothetical protein
MTLDFQQYMKKLLLINGIADLFAAVMLIVLVKPVGDILGFASLDEVTYLSGGWGMGVLSFAFIRIYASKSPESYPLMLLFGLFEAISLFIYCIIIMLVTSITVIQAGFSLGMAVIFGIGYIYGKMLQKKS